MLQIPPIPPQGTKWVSVNLAKCEFETLIRAIDTLGLSAELGCLNGSKGREYHLVLWHGNLENCPEDLDFVIDALADRIDAIAIRSVKSSAESMHLSVVHQWLESVKGMDLHIGRDGGTEPISQADLLTLAQSCECAEVRQDNRLPNVFADYLVIGTGDFLEWCRSGGKSETSKFYFIYAANQP